MYPVTGSKAGTPDRFKQTQRAQPNRIACIFRSFKADFYVALRTQVVNFIGLDIGKQADQRNGVGEVGVVEK